MLGKAVCQLSARKHPFIMYKKMLGIVKKAERNPLRFFVLCKGILICFSQKSVHFLFLMI